MSDNVVSLVRKEEIKGYIEIKWTSGEIEIIQADSFGPYEDLKGYIIVFKDPDEVVGLFNSDTIASIKVLKEAIYNKYRVE